MKKLGIVLASLILVGVLFFATPLGTYAVSMFTKTLAGMAQMTFTDEVTITNLKINSLSKVTVSVESKTNTVAGRVYEVWLYLDDVKWATPQTVTWTAGEIPGTIKKVIFTGLSLGSTTLVEAEVIY